jgi:hypothetical protein
VFISSMVIVIGPTPPGTGVMCDATSLTPAKSTSPHSLPSLVAVDADVDHDRARLDHVGGQRIAAADAATTTSAWRVYSPGPGSRYGRW